jgi:membrane protein implicated in regulation of membrane protease activity
MQFFLSFLDFFGLAWFWLCVAAVFLCLELLLGGSAFFLALASAALVPALTAAAFDSVTPLESFGLYAGALIPAAALWGKYWRARARRGTEQQAGAPALNNRMSGLVGNTAVIETDFPNGKGWVKVDGVFWPCECSQALKSGEKVRVVEADGILLKVVKAVGK